MNAGAKKMDFLKASLNSPTQRASSPISRSLRRTAWLAPHTIFHFSIRLVPVLLDLRIDLKQERTISMTIKKRRIDKFLKSLSKVEGIVLKKVGEVRDYSKSWFLLFW